jgi:hypothetical protein
MDGYLVIALLVNTALSAIVANVAFLRGKSPGAFFALSFLASFLVGILVLIALTGSDNSSDNSSDKDRMNCPFCDEAISPNAKICQFCKSDVVAHFEEVTQRDVAVQAQAAKDEAEKSAALELEEREANKLSEQRRLQEAQSRKLLVAKLLRSPIAWITTVLLLGGSVGTFLVLTEESRQEAAEANRVAELEEEEVERIRASLEMIECTISEDAIGINFYTHVFVNVQLPSDCHEGIKAALKQGDLAYADAGQLRIQVFLDSKLVASKLIRYSREGNDYRLPVRDLAFQEHRRDYGKVAAMFEVTAQYTRNAYEPEATVVSVPIPNPETGHRFFRVGTSTLFGTGLSASVRLTSYFAVDEVFFDWPGFQFDELQNASAGTPFRSRVSDLSSGALTITAYLDGVIVQTEVVNYTND